MTGDCSAKRDYWFETPAKVTIFHDGSNDENCHENKTISDIEYPNWYCSSPKWTYPVGLLGMVITAMSMSLRAGLPSKLTAQWFDANEYDIANSLASLGKPFGTMITCLATPFIAKEPSDLSHLLIYFAIPVFLSFIGSLFIRQEGCKNEVKKQSFKALVGVLINRLRMYFLD